MIDNIENIEKLIGRAVVSLESANKLGQLSDLLVEPISGKLAGLAVQRPDETCALVSMVDVHQVGPDAIIVKHDAALVFAGASPLTTLPKVKANLVGVKVITEHGQLLGNISNLFLCSISDPVFIYEVRSSLFDTLLGRAFYLPGSVGSAFAADGSSLVVTGAAENMDHDLKASAERVTGPHSAKHHKSPVRVEVRTQRALN